MGDSCSMTSYRDFGKESLCTSSLLDKTIGHLSEEWWRHSGFPSWCPPYNPLKAVKNTLLKSHKQALFRYNQHIPMGKTFKVRLHKVND
ncbi:hypothetical protein GDO78_003837 [Eleutherodactylus coqui]|uniref:Uncharacterized protein n=1 Tax=Eleutherodactylus coqui TaxID=57060 RepID=A0A8J6K143_ELECQ|nr:hypothetical protein GDO78_003837 [Eleutherodactylus coqui]